MRERAKQKKSEKYVTETAVLLLCYPIQYIHYLAHELALEIFRALPLTYFRLDRNKSFDLQLENIWVLDVIRAYSYAKQSLPSSSN